MRRSALVLFLALAGLTATAPSARAAGDRPTLISVIELTGLEQIDEEVVRTTMRLKVGDPFHPERDRARLQADIDGILALGWFQLDAQNPERGSTFTWQRDPDGNIELRFRLVENPPIERIDMRGAQLPSDEIAVAVPWLRVGRPLNTNPERLRVALRALEAAFRERGREVACRLPGPGEAPPWFERTASGGVVVHIKAVVAGSGEERPTVTDGPGEPPGEPGPGTGDQPLVPGEALKVTSIEVLGLQHIPREIVLDTIQTKEGQAYDADQLAADMDALRELGWFYHTADREYLQAIGYPVRPATVGSVAHPAIDREQGQVTVYFDLVENPLIHEVRLVGNTLVPTPKLLGELRYLVAGRVLNTSRRLDADLQRLEEAYAGEGYAAFVRRGRDVDPLITPEADGSVTVTIQLQEVTVGAISFDWGDRSPRTSERVFRSYMRTRVGRPFNLGTIQDDIREIVRLDILEDFRLSRDLAFDPEDPSKVNLTFEVTEKRTGNIGAGGGISSRFGLVGFVELSENNLFGLAQRAAGRVEFGGRFDFTGSYFWPLLDGAGTELSFRLYNTEDRTGASGIGAFTNRRTSFDQTRRGGSIGVSRPLLPDLRGSLQYQLENVTTQRRGSLLPNLPSFPFQDLNSDTTSSLTLGLAHDTRDYPLDATTGGLRQATIELAGLGGDNNFGKYRFELRHYLPVFGETVEISRRQRAAWVLALRGMYGFATGDLPFSQSFFIGGADTLRGFEEDEFFGDRAFLFNIELRRQFKNNIGAAVFFDAGRAWRTGERMDFLNDLASAVGLGLRVLTPVGPLRLDLGFGPDGSQTHFSFGQPF